jgi:orotate phosphoribosyltransferase
MFNFETYKKILYERILNNSIKWNQGILRGSGKPAGWTIDMREEMLDPYYSNIISEIFMEWIEAYKPDYVAGLAITGGFIASQIVLLSYLKGCPLKGLYIRKKPKINGLQKQIEGPLKKKSRVIIVDDAINSGDSALEAIKLLSEEGCLTVAFLSILNFEGKGTEYLNKLNIPLHYLFTVRDLSLKPSSDTEKSELYSMCWQAGAVTSGIYNRIPSCSPVFAGKRIFLGSDFGRFLSINQSGTLQWSFDTDYSQPVFTDPLIRKDRVCFSSCDGSLYCLSALKGNLLWKFKDPCLSDSFSPVSSPDGKIIFTGGLCCDGSGLLFAVDSMKGQVLWNFTSQSGIMATPVISRSYNLLIFTSMDGTVYCSDMSGNIKWRSAYGVINGMALDENTGTVCFFSGGSFYSVDIVKGSELCKRKLSSLDYSAPVIKGDKIVASASSDFIFCFDKSGKVLWQNCLGDNWSMPGYPVIFNDRVYASNSSGEIFVLELQKGRIIWNFFTGSPVRSSPLVLSGKIFHDLKFPFPDFNEKSFNIYENKIYILNNYGFIESYNFEFTRLLWSVKYFNLPSEYKTLLFVTCSNGYIYCFMEE